MKTNKKGLEAIQLIVTAVIALVILVIILAIFSGRFTRFIKGVETEEQAGVSLRDWFAGYGCQPVPQGCTRIDATGNDDAAKTGTCQSSGCNFVTGATKCSGESSNCRQKTTPQACAPLQPNLCRWVQKPE